MKKERKIYARYIIVREHVALWKGDAAEAGSLFRSVVITSDEFTATHGIFQVYALEGIGKGIQHGEFAGAEDPHLLLDEDFQGIEAAAQKFAAMVRDSEAKGFKRINLWDQIEIQGRLQRG